MSWTMALTRGNLAGQLKKEARPLLREPDVLALSGPSQDLGSVPTRCPHLNPNETDRKGSNINLIRLGTP